jgi:2-amino-4-hydroxy-6-hydroxymethyldihydropteridine diphosphokinase
LRGVEVRWEVVYLSLGSNLGDRRRNLSLAFNGIARLPGARNVRVSSIYETEPVGAVKDQPLFLNAVVSMGTEMNPDELLDRLAGIESELGRSREFPGGPRTMDIDVLLFGSSVINSERLVVPHPRMAGRRFVLEPLVELEPDLIHPLTGVGFERILSLIGNEGGRIVGVEPWPEIERLRSDD